MEPKWKDQRSGNKLWVGGDTGTYCGSAGVGTSNLDWRAAAGSKILPGCMLYLDKGRAPRQNLRFLEPEPFFICFC